MLGKLIKHEFRATGRLILPLMAAVLALSVLAGVAVKVVDTNETSAFIRTISVFLIIGFIVALIAISVVVFVQMIGRFYKNLLGDEGYLMFTLPTTPDAIIWSRLIVSSVWFVAVSILCFAAMLVMGLIGAGEFYISFDLSELSGGMNKFLEYLGNGSIAAGRAHFAAYIVEALVACFLGCCVTCLNFYAPIAMGYSFSNHKGLLAVVFFFAITIVENIVSVAVLNTGILENIADALTPARVSLAASVHYVFLGFLLTELVYGAIYYAITSIFLRKRLNLP